MEWTKLQSGSAASISSETHGAHRSLRTSDDESYITVVRRKPEFKALGKAKSFQEAVLMCEKDYEDNSNGSQSEKT